MVPHPIGTIVFEKGKRLDCSYMTMIQYEGDYQFLVQNMSRRTADKAQNLLYPRKASIAALGKWFPSGR
jgi:hypothetical protein